MIRGLEIISFIALILTFVFSMDAINKNDKQERKYFKYYVTEIIIIILCEIINKF